MVGRGRLRSAEKELSVNLRPSIYPESCLQICCTDIVILMSQRNKTPKNKE